MQSPNFKDCASATSGISDDAAAIMQDAYDTVTRLEHQTLVAESTYQNLCSAADAIKAYAQTVRYELERASQQLNQYQIVTRNCTFAVSPRPLHASNGLQTHDPRSLYTGSLFLFFERAQCSLIYLKPSHPLWVQCLQVHDYIFPPYLIRWSFYFHFPILLAHFPIPLDIAIFCYS